MAGAECLSVSGFCRTKWLGCRSSLLYLFLLEIGSVDVSDVGAAGSAALVMISRTELYWFTSQVNYD